MYKSGPKSLYDDVTSAVDNIFDQWVASITTPMEEVCEVQGVLYWKLNLIQSHSIREFWSAYGLFS